MKPPILEEGKGREDYSPLGASPCYGINFAYIFLQKISTVLGLPLAQCVLVAPKSLIRECD